MEKSITKVTAPLGSRAAMRAGSSDARLFRRSLCAGFQRAQELVAQRHCRPSRRRRRCQSGEPRGRYHR